MSLFLSRSTLELFFTLAKPSKAKMNSLADAAIQASAAAAAAVAPEETAGTLPLSTTSALALSDASGRPESSSSLLDRPSSSHASYRRSDPTVEHSQFDASTSPASEPGSPYNMIKGNADTPLRRALLDTEKPEKRGSNLACLKCRAIKVKCSRASAEDERCKRCNRLDLVCEFKEHHRGRKPKKRPRSEAESTGADEEDQLEDDQANPNANPNADANADADATLSSKTSTASPVRSKRQELSRSPLPSASTSRQQHYRTSSSSSYTKAENARFDINEPPPRLPSPKGSVHGRWFGPYLQPIPSFEDSLFARKQRPHSSAHHLQQHHNDPSNPNQPHQHLAHHHHSYHIDRSCELPPLSIPSSSSSNRPGLSPNDQGSWDRTSTWNATNRNSVHRLSSSVSTGSTTLDLSDDAVRQHVITMDQARELFDNFFAELNPPLALLDTSLHTIDYCRKNTPILFSTIISVASRFFMPHHHRQCHRVAKSILNHAAAEEICTLDHVQALILVITWKDPGDRTILRKAVRAIGYAYELGLHATFDDFDIAEPLSSSSSTSTSKTKAEGKRDPSDNYSLQHRRRQQRDRQRTWIVLCLIHELVRRDDRNPRPRARVIPLEDYPDPYPWLKQAGDVFQPVDSRLGWSLGMAILTLENEPFLDLIERSQDATSFATFFERYRGGLDKLRKLYFDVRDGVYHPRFAMDKSAVAELPYLDAFRDYYICQSTWHWAAKVASRHRRQHQSSELAEQQDNARSAFWFSQTVDAAMRCLRLFAHVLCKDGYVRVGHDYLVISASEVTKWFYLYREHLDASTVVAGVEYLRAALRECSQPQRLASGEVVNTEREAPGYFVRFLGAIFDAGLNESLDKANQRLSASVERFGTKGFAWNEPRRERPVEERAGPRREAEAGRSGISSNTGSDGNGSSAATRRPQWSATHSSYQQQQASGVVTPVERSNSAMAAGASASYRDPMSAASASARFGSAASLARGRSEVELSRTNVAPVSGGSKSYERGGGVADKVQSSANMFGVQHDNGTGNAGAVNATNSIAPHPAYLASAVGASSVGQVAANFGVQTGGSAAWCSANAPSWSSAAGSALPTNSVDEFHLAFGDAPLTTPAANTSTPAATAINVTPLAADIGKNSIEGLAACLNARDLTYWQDILGFDLASPAV